MISIREDSSVSSESEDDADDSQEVLVANQAPPYLSSLGHPPRVPLPPFRLPPIDQRSLQDLSLTNLLGMTNIEESARKAPKVASDFRLATVIKEVSARIRGPYRNYDRWNATIFNAFYLKVNHSYLRLPCGVFESFFSTLRAIPTRPPTIFPRSLVLLRSLVQHCRVG